MKYRKNNVLLLLEEKTDVYGDRVALGIRTALGWKEFTYKGLGLLSRKLGSYLINELEVQKNDRVAILSESKPEYGACVFASILSGATTVPLDIKLTKFELVSILTDCQPKVLLVSQTYIAKGSSVNQTHYRYGRTKLQHDTSKFIHNKFNTSLQMETQKLKINSFHHLHFRHNR